MDTTLVEESPRARLALLLKHFSELDDDREAWRVHYPIKEVRFVRRSPPATISMTSSNGASSISTSCGASASARPLRDFIPDLVVTLAVVWR